MKKLAMMMLGLGLLVTYVAPSFADEAPKKDTAKKKGKKKKTDSH